MKYKVEILNSDKVLIMTEDEWRPYIHAVARTENYGMFRHWERDGALYFDCGPRTFRVTRMNGDAAK